MAECRTHRHRLHAHASSSVACTRIVIGCMHTRRHRLHAHASSSVACARIVIGCMRTHRHRLHAPPPPNPPRAYHCRRKHSRAAHGINTRVQPAAALPSRRRGRRSARCPRPSAVVGGAVSSGCRAPPPPLLGLGALMLEHTPDETFLTKPPLRPLMATDGD